MGLHPAGRQAAAMCGSSGWSPRRTRGPPRHDGGDRDIYLVSEKGKGGAPERYRDEAPVLS